MANSAAREWLMMSVLRHRLRRHGRLRDRSRASRVVASAPSSARLDDRDKAGGRRFDLTTPRRQAKRESVEAEEDGVGQGERGAYRDDTLRRRELELRRCE